MKGAQQYNAYEKDIAVVNLFFGDSTVFGKPQSTSKMISANLHLSFAFVLTQSLRDPQR